MTRSAILVGLPLRSKDFIGELLWTQSLTISGHLDGGKGSLRLPGCDQTWLDDGQIILKINNLHSEFISKCLQIVLESRIPSLRLHDPNGIQTGLASSSEYRARRKDKWFHLALGPSPLENLNCYRNVLEPNIVDVVLVHDASPLGESSAAMNCWKTTDDFKQSSETILERWVLQFESLKTSGKMWVGSGQTKFDNAQVNSHSAEGPAASKKTYKRLIILLRSLYSTSRLLPAYRLFRMLNSSNQTCNFNINYNISSFCEPFSRKDEEAMQEHSFLPVETPFGRLCVSVMYRPVLSDLNLEFSTSLPPLIITDYVGSPAAEPQKFFPSGSSAKSVDKGVRSTSFPMHGIRSPSSSPLQRPHSWTSGIYRAMPPRYSPSNQYHPLNVSPSPSPAFSDSHSLPFGHRYPPRGPLVDNSPPISSHLPSGHRISAHKKGTSFDELCFSPPFSPSSSPSTPTHSSGCNLLQTRLHLGSDPVTIPSPVIGRAQRYLTPNLSDPNRTLLPPPSPRSMKADLLSHNDSFRAPASQVSGFQESPSESKSFRKMDVLRPGEYYTGVGNLHSYPGQKGLKDSRDDSGRFSGVVSSSGSPRIGFSRSSSKLSFQDDLDDSEFTCPFAVDDIDTTDSHTRTIGRKEAQQSSQTYLSAGKSQDAVVGALVQMLRTAPPLRQDNSYSSHSPKSEYAGNLSASGFFTPRKASDALEELRSYREMKDLLLSQSGTQLLESMRQKTK